MRTLAAILVTAYVRSRPAFWISNFINPWIVDIGASLSSMGVPDACFLKSASRKCVAVAALRAG